MSTSKQRNDTVIFALEYSLKSGLTGGCNRRCEKEIINGHLTVSLEEYPESQARGVILAKTFILLCLGPEQRNKLHHFRLLT